MQSIDIENIVTSRNANWIIIKCIRIVNGPNTGIREGNQFSKFI